MDELKPTLTERGKREAQKAINTVREDMIDAARDIIDKACSDIYGDIAEYIDSDSWSSYRRSVIQGVAGYRDLYKHESKPIRDQILRENRDDLIKDLNQDLLNEIDALNKRFDFMKRSHY